MEKEIIDMLKDDDVKVKDLWLNVYNEKTGKKGYVSVSCILDTIVELVDSEIADKTNSEVRHG